MKKTTRIIAIICTMIMAFGAFGCGGSQDDKSGDKNTLSVFYWASGYGKEYMQNVVRAFMEKNPDINVELSASANNAGSEVWENPDDVTTDLYFNSTGRYNAYLDYFEPLDTLLDSEVDGVKLSSKFSDDVLEICRSNDGHIYTVPYASGLGGMIYNATVFEEKGYEVPKTTDELIDLCVDIKSDEMTPFVFFSEYWNYMLEIWMAQYSGFDGFYKFWNGVYVDENGEEHANVADLFTKNKGRDESYEVIYDLLSPKGNAYVGTNQLSHTVAQTYFLNRKGILTISGSWLENEMKGTSSTDTFKLMKTPVISALADVVGLKSDKELASVVAYVDGDATEAQKDFVQGLDQKIVERVREARNYVIVEPAQNTTLIPKVSTKKDLAKKFLQFYFSDESLEIIENTCGMSLPCSYSNGSNRKNPDKDSAFVKSCIDIINLGGKKIGRILKVPLFYNTDMEFIYHENPAIYYTYGNEMMGYKDFIEKENKYWTDNWDSYLSDAGL